MIATQKISPCLWFEKDAEEAARFYASLFPNSSIDTVRRYGAGAPMPEGTVMTVAFHLSGVAFLALNGGPMFKPTGALSLMVSCDTQEEIDRLWTGLSSNGGKELECGWVLDRWGYSWQITPTAVTRLTEDPARAARVMQALWTMKKIDIAALEAAYRGA